MNLDERFSVGGDVLVRAKVVKISRDGRPEDAEFTHCVEIDGYNKWVLECDLVPADAIRAAEQAARREQRERDAHIVEMRTSGARPDLVAAIRNQEPTP
jgi:hypothetical protein